MKTSIVGTGLTGMVGSRIVELLGDNYTFSDLRTQAHIDTHSPDQLNDFFKQSNASLVLHTAAKTDVDSCETDKESAWKINVEATQNIVNACISHNKKLIYISTDFVFDGAKDFYTEDDVPHPVNYYGKTKYEAEQRVLRKSDSLIVRISYPYRAAFPAKKDFVHKFLELLQKGSAIEAPDDNLFCPTYVDDIGHALDVLIQHNATGIFHVGSNSAISSFDAVCQIAELGGFSKEMITPTSFNTFYKNRAPRPLRLVLKHDKIAKLGIRMKSFTDGLKDFL